MSTDLELISSVDKAFCYNNEFNRIVVIVSIYRLFLIKKPRYIIAEVRHFENGPVVTASSAEFALKKQLYRYEDLQSDI